jgi:hypothetical protein
MFPQMKDSVRYLSEEYRIPARTAGRNGLIQPGQLGETLGLARIVARSPQERAVANREEQLRPPPTTQDTPDDGPGRRRDTDSGQLDLVAVRIDDAD